MASEHNTVTIRPASASYEEGLACARYINIASEGGFRKALGKRYADIIATAFVEPDHELSWMYTVFAEQEDQIVGMTSGAPAEVQARSSTEPLKLAPGNRARRNVGIALIGMVFHVFGEMNEDSYYLQMLAVDEACRGQGIGTQLLDYMEDRARNLGCRSFVIDVSAKNTGAKRLYEGRGLTIVSMWPKSPLLPRVVCRLSKDLKGPA